MSRGSSTRGRAAAQGSTLLGLAVVFALGWGAGCSGDPLNRPALEGALATARPDNAPPARRGQTPPLAAAGPTVTTV